MEDAEKTEKEVAAEGAEKDVEMQEAGKTEKDGAVAEVENEVTKENQVENKSVAFEAKEAVPEPGETAVPVAKDEKIAEAEKQDTEKSEGDKTSVKDVEVTEEKQGPQEPAGKQDGLQEQVMEVAEVQDTKQSEGDKASIEDAEVKAEKQGPPEPAEKQDSLQEQVKTDAEEGKKEAAAQPEDARNLEDQQGVNPSQLTTQENTVGGENSNFVEQPQREKQDGLPEQVKPDADVSSVAKDNGTAVPGLTEELKGKYSLEGDISKKVMEVTENGSQASEARS